MITQLMRQQGFLAAHGIWCVSDGGPLVPFVGVKCSNGEQELVRFVDEEDYGRGVEKARAFLASGSEGAVLATLVYDGFVTLEEGRTDALILEGVVYGELVKLTQVVPYRSRESRDGFAVYRPKLVAVETPVPPDYKGLGDAFFGGVDEHEQGAKVWNEHLDQSR